MVHLHRTLQATAGRCTLVLLLVFALAPLARAGGTGAPVAKNVRASLAGAATHIIITGTAPMAFTVRRTGEHTLLVELPGVDASPLAPLYRVSTPLVNSVAVKQAFKAGSGEKLTSLEVNLRAPVRERSRLDGNELVLELLPAAAKEGNTAAAPPSRTEQPAQPAAPSNDPKPLSAADSQQGPQAVPAAAGAPQTTQGQQYGQPGFVGEPINLNVANADIRDILNYITEQYGVNFVVDSSVPDKVPVTVNVTDVPWNFALDSILRANRLGVEITGNILRIATLQVLSQESRVRAEEASARTLLREAQLENSPLVTEFIRLNYARAVGTLAGAAGSTGGFSGGTTRLSFSGGSGGDSTGGSGDQGILPIIARRLSRRGGVETDPRSNTLIVTDVRENIDAIRQLIMLLDQPEPQVEIETRIVIATRNFSRDLGVQLSAAVFNPSRGAGGSFENFQTTDAGLVPNGIPGGLVNTPPPAAGQGATAATTIIGLTTGIFGTAQIGALITAAETKGQAKIIATPRVTALNNRPAQIESGSQIPVVTPQSGTAGATAVFTTTFVSVPLRLSITPQITDAGTVVLRVVMENNSVNLTLTNSLGTPGIDTQRMQTEVLVPDGGTTVVGGVLNDRESDNQTRTPGLAGIPLLGNLFKRKAAVRNTDEILFFITPRIYRPDYQGRRTETTLSTGTRSVQLPQPVPLGNPSSNTPPPNAPTQQQQQQEQPQPQQPTPSGPQATQPAATPNTPPAGGPNRD